MKFKSQLYYRDPVSTREVLQVLALGLKGAIKNNALSGDASCTVEYVGEEKEAVQPQDVPWQSIRLITTGKEVQFKSQLKQKVGQ